MSAGITKGSKLMIFLDGQAIGYATSHSLSVTLNTTEVSTKDHGDYPAVTPQSVSWEITAENLYSDGGEATYMELALSKQLVDVVFAPASNYSDTDEKGILGDDAQHSSWSAGTAIASGKAYVTSFSVNAPAGDNATMSVTFTGNGALDQEPAPSGTQGTQGTQGN